MRRFKYIYSQKSMLFEIHHLLYYGRNCGRLVVLPNVAPGMPKFRFTVLPRGDIYESKYYMYDDLINPDREELKYLFDQTPVIKRVRSGTIDIAFQDSQQLYGFGDVDVHLTKLPPHVAAVQHIAEDPDQTFIARIESIEKRMSVLEKLR